MSFTIANPSLYVAMKVILFIKCMIYAKNSDLLF